MRRGGSTCESNQIFWPAIDNLHSLIKPSRVESIPPASWFNSAAGRRHLQQNLLQPAQQRTFRKELKSIYGVPYCPAHIARLEVAGQFPKRAKLDACRVAWVAEEVETRIEEKSATAKTFSSFEAYLAVAKQPLMAEPIYDSTLERTLLRGTSVNPLTESRTVSVWHIPASSSRIEASIWSNRTR